MWASEGKAPGPTPKIDAAPGQVVEIHHAVGHQEGVVVGQRHHAGAELDALGALGRGGDEDLGGRDRLVPVAVVLPHPGLVVAELVQPLDQLEVPPDGQRRVLRRVVQRPDEACRSGEACPCRPMLLTSPLTGPGEWALSK